MTKRKFTAPEDFPAEYVDEDGGNFEMFMEEV